MSLEDIYIEKSKYIRKEYINGHWRYWYEEPKVQDRVPMGFGVQHKGFSNRVY